MKLMKFLIAFLAISTLFAIYSCEKEYSYGPKITVVKPIFNDSVKVNKKLAVKTEFYDIDGLQTVSLNVHAKLKGNIDTLLFTSLFTTQGVETFKLDTSLTFAQAFGAITLHFQAKDFDGTPSEQVSFVKVYQ
ncbi:MAG: hypothetical protein JNK66_02575 [Chitinophagales bacterium]|nr:hypothetical protein [Chitinophagales bacterium]